MTDFHLKAKFDFTVGCDDHVKFHAGWTYEVIASGETRTSVRCGSVTTSFNAADLGKHFERIEGPFKPKYTLEGLLEDVTPENCHGEILSGPPVGREII
jgi:hypothetical protein